MHVQQLSSTSRRNLLAPVGPVAVRAKPVAAPAGPTVAPAGLPAAPARQAAAPARPAAAPGYNFAWRNNEENPNRRNILLEIQSHQEKLMLLIL